MVSNVAGPFFLARWRELFASAHKKMTVKPVLATSPPHVVVVIGLR
jgi:hypothetical protein